MEMLKFAVSAIMGTLGAYFMYRGKKIQNTRMIIWGGVMIVLSYFLFSGGGDDDAAKDLLKNALPSANSTPLP